MGGQPWQQWRGNVHQLVYWAGWKTLYWSSSLTIIYQICQCSPTGTLGRLDGLIFMNNNLSKYADVDLCTFLWYQFLPADGVCPMAHRSALWWGLPIQLHRVEGENKFPVSQSQNLVKFSWRWRIQEMKKPQVLVTALATKPVRWLGFFSSARCSSFTWNMTATFIDYLGFSRCQRFVHCARSLLQWEKSPLGDSASNRSSTSETSF